MKTPYIEQSFGVLDSQKQSVLKDLPPHRASLWTGGISPANPIWGQCSPCPGLSPGRHSAISPQSSSWTGAKLCLR